MKCKNCEHFSFAKCVEDRCLGGCEIDSQNRTVHMESDCIVSVEDLRCFVMDDGGEIEHVMARSEEEAIAYYSELTGFEYGEYEVSEIIKWHDVPLRVEAGTESGWENTTFLEFVKINYDPATFEPYVIASTAC